MLPGAVLLLPLLFGAAPELKIAGGENFRLSLLHFAFLHAKVVGIGGGEKIKKAFLHTGSQSVYVPRNQFHNTLLFYDYIG